VGSENPGRERITVSPVGYVVLKMLRGGALASAMFAVLVVAIELWKAGGDTTALNPGLIILMAAICAGALWLARAIGRELAGNGS
jgi:hypothetical protein